MSVRTFERLRSNAYSIKDKRVTYVYCEHRCTIIHAYDARTLVLTSCTPSTP